MSDSWKPTIRVRPFADSPEEFRALPPFGGGEEAALYVPPELFESPIPAQLAVSLVAEERVQGERGRLWAPAR
jgi:hypothetical protein